MSHAHISRRVSLKFWLWFMNFLLVNPVLLLLGPLVYHQCQFSTCSDIPTKWIYFSILGPNLAGGRPRPPAPWTRLNNGLRVPIIACYVWLYLGCVPKLIFVFSFRPVYSALMSQLVVFHNVMALHYDCTKHSIMITNLLLLRFNRLKARINQ